MAGFWDTMFGGGAEREAAEKNRAIAAQYGTDAQGYLKTGYDTGVTNLNKGVEAFDPLTALATKFNKAGDLSLDALGVNGPEGSTRATGSFQTTPGYEIAQKAALEAIQQRRALASGWNAGQTDMDIGNDVTKRLYETQYAPWMAGLERAGNMGGQYTTNAATGRAAGFGSLASLAQQFASGQAGVAGNVASGEVAANNLQAGGEASGAKNLLGAGISLASLAAAPFTGGASLAGLGTALGGGGGGGPIVPGSPTTGPRPLYG